MVDIGKWVRRVEREEFWGPRQNEPVVNVKVDPVHERKIRELVLGLSGATCGLVTHKEIKVSSLTGPVRDEGARNRKWSDRIRLGIFLR